MPLELRPLEEADLPIYDEIMWQAFRTGIMGVMYPQGYSQAARDQNNASSLKAWRERPDRFKKLKVVDTDLPADDPFNGIVGVSSWNFFPKPRTDEELDQDAADKRVGGPPPGANPEMLKDFFGALGKAKREHLGGRAHILLHILVTHPKHHRRGVGALQLRWGAEQADELGVPIWLESSPIGKPLYDRNGFETVGWLDFDARKYGSETELRHALMLKPAKGRKRQ